MLKVKNFEYTGLYSLLVHILNAIIYAEMYTYFITVIHMQFMLAIIYTTRYIYKNMLSIWKPCLLSFMFLWQRSVYIWSCKAKKLWYLIFIDMFSSFAYAHKKKKKKKKPSPYWAQSNFQILFKMLKRKVIDYVLQHPFHSESNFNHAFGLV